MGRVSGELLRGVRVRPTVGQHEPEVCRRSGGVVQKSQLHLCDPILTFPICIVGGCITTDTAFLGGSVLLPPCWWFPQPMTAANFTEACSRPAYLLPHGSTHGLESRLGAPCCGGFAASACYGQLVARACWPPAWKAWKGLG